MCNVVTLSLSEVDSITEAIRFQILHDTSKSFDQNSYLRRLANKLRSAYPLLEIKAVAEGLTTKEMQP